MRREEIPRRVGVRGGGGGGDFRKPGGNEKPVIVQNYMQENPDYFTHSQVLNIQSIQPKALPKECLEVAPPLALKYNELLGVEEDLD